MNDVVDRFVHLSYSRFMKIVLGLFVTILMMLAIAGLGFGVFAIYEAVKHAHEPGAELGVLALLEMAVIPVLVGTVALAGASIVFAVDFAREEHTNLLTQIAVATRKALPTPPIDPVAAANIARGDIYADKK